MDCQTVQEKLPLYLYDELSAEERSELEAHLAACAACAGAAEELRRLRAACDQRPVLEPSPELLVECRWELEESLDREARGWRGLVHSGWGLWPAGATFRFSAALAILLVGVSLGWALRHQVGAPARTAAGQPGPWIGADLSDLRISGISQVAPDPQTGQVRITLDAERRVHLAGSFDDPRIQQVLIYTVKSYDNPGIRHDTLEVLRPHSADPTVREAVLFALQNDPNAGVRLEALNAVRELPWTHELRAAILDVLERDTNPGMRVAAINTLLEHADEQVLPTLEKLAAQDANPYVRLKCANAVRELARNEF